MLTGLGQLKKKKKDKLNWDFVGVCALTRQHHGIFERAKTDPKNPINIPIWGMSQFSPPEGKGQMEPGGYKISK